MGTDKELNDLLDFSMVSWARLLPSPHTLRVSGKGAPVKAPPTARTHVCEGPPGEAGKIGVPSDRHALRLSAFKGTWNLGVCSGIEWVPPTTLQMGKLRPKEQLPA